VEGRGSSGHARVRCPACLAKTGREDYRKSVSVNLRNGWWKCWRCDTRGRVPGDWGDADDLSPDDGWEDVDDYEEPSDYVQLGGGSSSLAYAPALQFLAKRRVPSEVYIAARVGYARTGQHGRRVIFPVLDADGAWRGWVGRHIGDGVPKYLTAPGMNRRRLFYNDAAVHDGTDPLLVVEGVFDALRHWPRAAACLGKPTHDQLARLAALRRPIIVALDGDAWREGLAAAESLRFRGADAYAVRLPPTTDPDTLDPQRLSAGVAYCLAAGSDADLT
jgi:hypothetical protein